MRDVRPRTKHYLIVVECPPAPLLSRSRPTLVTDARFILIALKQPTLYKNLLKHACK